MSNEEMDRLAPPAQMIDKSGSLEIIPENCSLDPSGRLSISLDDKNVSSPSSCGSPIQSCRHTQSLSRPPTTSRGQRSEVKSYSCLPQVRIFCSIMLDIIQNIYRSISIYLAWLIFINFAQNNIFWDGAVIGFCVRYNFLFFIAQYAPKFWF